MPVFYYEGFRIGLVWIFRTTNTLHYPQLAVSRDGARFEREFREPLIRVGDYGDFDESTVYVRTAMVHDGQIRIYYYGGNWERSGGPLRKRRPGRLRRGSGDSPGRRIRLGGLG